MRHLLCTGFFALEGETTCAHRCADAAALGVAGSVACDMTASASGGAVAALTFAQIRGITPQPFSDWYGVRNTSDPRGAVWNSIPTDTGVVWHAGSQAGHAPSGGEPITLTWYSNSHAFGSPRARCSSHY